MKGRARKLGVQKMRLTEHMKGERVQKHVGRSFWEGSFKFCVEREPVDRFCSWYRWYNKRHNDWVSMDWMLDLLESGTREELRATHLHHSWNAPIYMGPDGVCVDMVCRFDRLEEDLSVALDRAGVNGIDIGSLPKYKVTRNQGGAG